MEFLMKPKYCHMCQETTSDHVTANCPTLVCLICSSKGHVKKFCPLVKDLDENFKVGKRRKIDTNVDKNAKSKKIHRM